jgi:hypothetical protein
MLQSIGDEDQRQADAKVYRLGFECTRKRYARYFAKSTSMGLRQWGCGDVTIRFEECAEGVG